MCNRYCNVDIKVRKIVVVGCMYDAYLIVHDAALFSLTPSCLSPSPTIFLSTLFITSIHFIKADLATKSFFDPACKSSLSHNRDGDHI